MLNRTRGKQVATLTLEPTEQATRYVVVSSTGLLIGRAVQGDGPEYLWQLRIPSRKVDRFFRYVSEIHEFLATRK